MKLEPGAHGIATKVVAEEDLAAVLTGSRDAEFPRVFATARMVALMELAAARVLVPLLQPGELSVGVTISVSHDAPTSLGATVNAEARFTGMEGKLYVFEVLARDGGGEVGRGTHKRAIVQVERLVARAKSRNEGPRGRQA